MMTRKEKVEEKKGNREWVRGGVRLAGIVYYL